MRHLPLAPTTVLAALLAFAPAPAAADAGPLLSEADLEHFKNSLREGDRRKWGRALAHARRATHPMPLHIATWRWLSADDGRTSWTDLRDFHLVHPHWPLAERRLRNAERLMPKDIPPREALAWFTEHPPVSGIGRGRHAEALAALGIDRYDRFAERIGAAWVEENFLPVDEQAFLRNYGASIRPADHVARLDRLIWNRSWGAARRQLRRVGPETRLLGDARIRLGRRWGGVDGAVARVPAHLQDHPGLLFERARWRRRAGLDERAREILRDPPAELGRRQDRWWYEARLQVRKLLTDRHPAGAYEIAAANAAALDHDPSAAEAEWMAGWIALSFLEDPAQALPHFTRMRERVSLPISVARASYWAARAAEGAEPGAAAGHYRDAARFSSTFYGQLAAHRIDQPIPFRGTRDPAPGRMREQWRANDMVEAVRVLAEAGHTRLLRTFILHLARQAENEDELILIDELCRESGIPHLAIHGFRRTVRGDLYTPALHFPHDLHREAFEAASGDVEPALLLAVARQESGFDAQARSPAGARGLIQLLPATARNVARSIGVRYRRNRLTEDPAYNVRIGSAYLASLLREFDGAYPLALAGYNAGPHRVRRWTRDYGNPLRGEIDMLDWMELIPFAETRNYVQRVLEGLTVYRWQLARENNGGRTDIVWNICPIGAPGSCPD